MVAGGCLEVTVARGASGGAFDAIGAALRGIVNSLNAALPGGMLAAVVFVLLVVVAWQLTKR